VARGLYAVYLFREFEKRLMSNPEMLAIKHVPMKVPARRRLLYQLFTTPPPPYHHHHHHHHHHHQIKSSNCSTHSKEPNPQQAEQRRAQLQQCV
jgi:G3E family GTPase